MRSDEYAALYAVVLLTYGLVVLVEGLDTDVTDEIVWRIIANGFLAIFVVELVLRICSYGFAFVADTSEVLWNAIDVLCVGCGFVELCMDLARLEGGGKESAADDRARDELQLPRMLRVLRVARLLR